MKVRIPQVVFGLVLAIGNWAGSASAIELFTNFNNGMELGTRPIGIEWTGPVRFHANEPAPLWPGRWTMGRCQPGAEQGSGGPVQFRQQEQPAEPIPTPRQNVPGQKRRASPERIEAQSEPAPRPFDVGAVMLKPEVEQVEIDRGSTENGRGNGPDNGDESTRDENWARTQSFLPEGS